MIIIHYNIIQDCYFNLKVINRQWDTLLTGCSHYFSNFAPWLISFGPASACSPSIWCCWGRETFRNTQSSYICHRSFTKTRILNIPNHVNVRLEERLANSCHSTIDKRQIVERRFSVELRSTTLNISSGQLQHSTLCETMMSTKNTREFLISCDFESTF